MTLTLPGGITGSSTAYPGPTPTTYVDPMGRAIPRLPDWVPTADDLNDISDASKNRQEVGSPILPLPVIFGRDRTYGRIAYVRVDDINGWLYLAVSFCETSHAIDKVYIDGIDVDDPDEGLVVAGGAIAYHAAGGASTILAAAITDYTDAPDACYVELKIPKTYARAFPRVEAIIRGKLLYDPRTATTAYSDNPVLAMCYIATRAGWDVDWVSAEEAADHNDTLLGGAKRRTLGLTLREPRPVEDWAKVFRVYTGCFLTWEGGVLRFIPDKAETLPAGLAMEVTADDIVRGTLVVKRRGVRDFPNRVVVEYRDSSDDANWRTARAQYPADVDIPAGTVVRTSRVKLDGIHVYAEAYREAKERQQRFRNDLSLEFTLFDAGLRLQIGSLFSFTHPIGIAGVVFRVIGFGNDRGRWRVQAENYDGTIYPSDAPSAPVAPSLQLGSQSSPTVINELIVGGTLLSSGAFGMPADEPWDPGVEFLVRVEGSITEARRKYVMTSTGSVVYSTTQAKFGSGSAYWAGGGWQANYLTINRGPYQMNFSAPWTFEAHVFFLDGTNQYVVAGNTGDFLVYKDTSDRICVYANHQSMSPAVLIRSAAVTNNAWHHIAVVGQADNTVHLYVDGVKQTDFHGARSSSFTAASIGSTTTDWYIGSALDGVLDWQTTTYWYDQASGGGTAIGTLQDFKGYLENVRFSTVARYTANFTPPTAAHPVPEEYPDKAVTQNNAWETVLGQDHDQVEGWIGFKYAPSIYTWENDDNEDMAWTRSPMWVAKPVFNGMKIWHQSYENTQAGGEVTINAAIRSTFADGRMRTGQLKFNSYAWGNLQEGQTGTAGASTLHETITVQGAGMTVANSNEDFTLEFWVYPYQLTGDGEATYSIAGTLGNSPVAGDWHLGMNAGTFRFNLYNSSAWRQAAFAGFTDWETWVHVAIVCSSGVVTLYINGVAGATTVSLPAADRIGTALSLAWYFGGSSHDPGSLGYSSALGMKGYIDEIRFTMGEARYTAGFTPPTATFPVPLPDYYEVPSAVSLRRLMQTHGTDVVTITGTSLQLTPFHAGKYLRFTSNSPITVTVLPDTVTSSMQEHSQFTLRQAGAGQITLSTTGGITIHSAESLKTRTQGSTMALIRVAADEFDLTGDLEAL